jgi:oxygen-independent coproporphyrinogen-3 oxidase
MEMCRAIGQELELQKDYLLQEPIETIYLGGGTPSLLGELELAWIFQFIHKNYSIARDSEITMEINPDDLTEEKLPMLKNIGINRLSIGVQSFDDSTLKFLNRSHNAWQAEKCIRLARQAGFNNISIDLIYAIPDRDASSLISDAKRLLSLSPEHISAYSLTVEEKTVFGKWVSTKKFIPSTDEENAKQFELLMEVFTSAGYDHYEISNYARPGFISRHNSNYWRQKKYLGVGPSAHSFDGTSRQANISNNHLYLKSIGEKKIPAVKEMLRREERINEYLMTSLRTSWGCDFSYLQQQFQYDLANDQAVYIRKVINEGLMETKENILHLTRTGKMHADKISSDLFLIT